MAATAAERQSKYRKTHPTAQQAYAQRIKDAAFGAYGGYICACCGETTKQFLTLDHIYNNGAEHRRKGIRGKQLYAWIKKNDFPPEFQVLCFNCNCGRAINGGICPHKAIERTPAIPQGATNG